jgi:hypothetical protein
LNGKEEEKERKEGRKEGENERDDEDEDGPFVLGVWVGVNRCLRRGGGELEIGG